jgi:hypothetical protein
MYRKVRKIFNEKYREMNDTAKHHFKNFKIENENLKI